MNDVDDECEVHTALPEYLSAKAITSIVLHGILLYGCEEGYLWAITDTDEAHEHLMTIIDSEEPTCH